MDWNNLYETLGCNLMHSILFADAETMDEIATVNADDMDTTVIGIS